MLTTSVLTTILIVLLIFNFVLWIAFLVFLAVQIRKLFQKVSSLVDEVSEFSSSMMDYSLKIAPLVLGVVKGIQAFKSINTLKNIWGSEPDEEKEVENDKGKK